MTSVIETDTHLLGKLLKVLLNYWEVAIFLLIESLKDGGFFCAKFLISFLSYRSCSLNHQPIDQEVH